MLEHRKNRRCKCGEGVGWRSRTVPGDSASTAGAVTALTVPYSSVSPAEQREQLSAGKQHLVHTQSELQARWNEAG